MDNQNGAEALIKKTIFRDPVKAFFNPCVLAKKEWISNQRTVSKGIAEMLKYLKVNLKNKLLADMLVHYFMFYDNQFLNKEIKPLSDFEIDKKSVELELKGVKEGKSFFSFWYFSLYEMTSDLEKFELADKYLDPFLIRNHFEDVAWILMSYLPAKEETRKNIYVESAKLALSKEAWQKDLWMKILTQEVIKREMEKTYPEVARPLFSLRRKVYSEILGRKVACAYAFYQLVTLGDEQKTYLDQLNSCPE